MDQNKKETVKEPKLLKSVLEAISCLKEKNGSTDKQIIKHITEILKNRRDSWLNVTVQVRRALDHGLNSGLIKKRNRKYVLSLDTDKTSKKSKQAKKSNTFKTKRCRSRKRDGMTRSCWGQLGQTCTDVGSDSDSSLSFSEGTPEPTDNDHRRSRSRKRNKRVKRGASTNRTNDEERAGTSQCRFEENIEFQPIAGCSNSRNSLPRPGQEDDTKAPSDVSPTNVPEQNDVGSDSDLN